MTSDEVDKMNADETGRQDCDNAQCIQLRKDRDRLIATVRDLTHSQLIGRDMELGLRAELMQAKIDLKHARASSAHDLALTRRSTTWRVGRLAMMPLVVSRRVLKSARRLVRK
ncbi:hypothetical protein JF66_18045 [Cryobacterium sp. MLB-32]|uniref:hypothetical protein n=1 Tax=Cryobacterium sp. MLB-32 TaxID=1529318 RepID=UPI0004E7BE1C|nr:hypothetical protein [Cryobacterium sp. MLB-32]KFF58514.1 hypothetical protein JF66_18045 [Cryobacterium sp. MLB-32]